MSIKAHYCKFCGSNLDSDYRCWDVSCKFAGVVQVAKHKAKLAKTEAEQAKASTPMAIQWPDPVGVPATVLCDDEGCPNHGIPHVCLNLSPTARKELAALEAESKRAIATSKGAWPKVWRSDKTVPTVQGQSETEELRLRLMHDDDATCLGLEFNRVPTDHERASLEVMIRLFLKGYNDARQR